MDTGLRAGDRIPPEYDNLMAKIMATGPDRPAAIDRLRRALDELEVTGVQTTLPFHRAVVRDPAFRADRLSTEWVGEHWDGPAARQIAAEPAAHAAALAAAGAGAPAAGAGVPLPSSGGPWRAAARTDAIDRAAR